MSYLHLDYHLLKRKERTSLCMCHINSALVGLGWHQLAEKSLIPCLQRGSVNSSLFASCHPIKQKPYMHTQTHFVHTSSECTELSFIQLMKKHFFLWLQLFESSTFSKSASVNIRQSGMRTKALTENSASRFSKCCFSVAFNGKSKSLRILHEWTKTTKHFKQL